MNDFSHVGVQPLAARIHVTCLSGPAASGKTQLMKALAKEPEVSRPVLWVGVHQYKDLPSYVFYVKPEKAAQMAGAGHWGTVLVDSTAAVAAQVLDAINSTAAHAVQYVVWVDDRTNP